MGQKFLETPLKADFSNDRLHFRTDPRNFAEAKLVDLNRRIPRARRMVFNHRRINGLTVLEARNACALSQIGFVLDFEEPPGIQIGIHCAPRRSQAFSLQSLGNRRVHIFRQGQERRIKVAFRRIIHNLLSNLRDHRVQRILVRGPACLDPPAHVCDILIKVSRHVIQACDPGFSGRLAVEIYPQGCKNRLCLKPPIPDKRYARRIGLCPYDIRVEQPDQDGLIYLALSFSFLHFFQQGSRRIGLLSNRFRRHIRPAIRRQTCRARSAFGAVGIYIGLIFRHERVQWVRDGNAGQPTKSHCKKKRFHIVAPTPCAVDRSIEKPRTQAKAFIAGKQGHSLMTSTTRADTRPLSPHLQIWRFHITMAASITHRFTGMALYFGTFLITAWIIALATSAGWYSVIEDIVSAWYGQVILFLWAVAVMYHFLNGIRHLLWDGPHVGFDPKTASTVSVFIYLFSIIGAAAIFAAATWL